jgi:hypothetical protein
MNFGLLMKTYVATQPETSASVLDRVRQVPRPLFGLSLVDSSSSCWALSSNFASRYSMTFGPIRFGFEAKGSDNGRLYFGHFAELWPTS